ncbi:hypothetical protein [Prosthecobacter sp.]|uniref:hypothetical protein n=1 Tax=Prosthecobacter sp. TaxID=1965333 RepID=UPI003783C2FD
MKPNPIAELPRTQREAVESAGYRVMRWKAAREVLRARVDKGRIAGELGGFLSHWMALAPAHSPEGELWLSFDHSPVPMKLSLSGGNAALADSPLEQALLHLPALRGFWRQELRQKHFAALRAVVPQAWLLDPAAVPNGAVIAGLGTGSWEQIIQERGQQGEIHSLRDSLKTDWRAALEARDSVWIPQKFSEVKLNAGYGRNDKGQVVLRSVEAP